MFKHIVGIFRADPRQLFMADGFGAMLSAFLLGFVLVRWENIFGIPAAALYMLAIIPVPLIIYDFYAYNTTNSKRLPGLLKGIAVMNLFYCCLSLGLASFHFSKITVWGWSYLCMEVMIIVVIAIVELQVANSQTD